MIAIVAAIREEVTGLKGLHRQSGGQAQVVVSGAGKERALAATRELLQQQPRPSAVVSTGFCAGLLDELHTGDLVLPRTLYLAGAGESLSADRRLSQLAEDCIHENVMPYVRRDSVTVPKLLLTVDEKLEAGRTYNAQAASLEDYWVCWAASNAGVPWVSTRAVLDTSLHSISPGIERLMWLRQEKGQLRGVLHAIGRPLDYPALILLARRARHAANRLGLFLRAFVDKALKGGIAAQG